MVAVASRYLLDTNIALYYLGGRLGRDLPEGEYGLSIITKMELLSFPGLSTGDEQTIRNFLSHLQVIDLNSAIKSEAIALRQQHRLRLPDAIVAATARLVSATLLTNDAQLLKIPGLDARSLPLKF